MRNTAIYGGNPTKSRLLRVNYFLALWATMEGWFGARFRMAERRLFGTLILIFLHTFGPKIPFQFFPSLWRSHGVGYPPFQNSWIRPCIQFSVKSFTSSHLDCIPPVNSWWSTNIWSFYIIIQENIGRINPRANGSSIAVDSHSDLKGHLIVTFLWGHHSLLGKDAFRTLLVTNILERMSTKQ